jgi:hypothetical protein
LAAEDRYFDPAADDEHGEVGGVSKRYGFADCRLPVVLSHNTPNNSLFLLWAEAEHSVRGLFPRVSRHQVRLMARNPFRVRASARAVSDEQFIKTFAASAVEILRDPKNPWGGLVFVRSAPGGGKTTLLRLLTPGSLKRAISYSDDQRYRATRDALQDAGVVDGQRALLWGVYLPFR